METRAQDMGAAKEMGRVRVPPALLHLLAPLVLPVITVPIAIDVRLPLSLSSFSLFTLILS